MSYKISKELFEVVTGIKDNFWIDGIHIEFENGMLNMTVYEFFFKCKEWALRQGYEIFTSGIKCSVYEISKGWIIDQLESTSEQQAVFDVCMYILDNKDKQ